MGIRVFWLEPTDETRFWLRRYRSNVVYSPDGDRIERPGCPLPMGYHNARVLFIESIAVAEEAESDSLLKPSEDSPQWPTHCDCGYAFAQDDERQLFSGRLYRGAPDGKLYTLQEAPAGAMWDASFGRHAPGDPWTGPDGISLVVKLPNGNDWLVDQEASNCTRTQWGPKEIDGKLHDKVWLGRTHYCWIRHGDPRTGDIHVDKNGGTCAAGAGSIQSGSYHGFLHHGELTPC